MRQAFQVQVRGAPTKRPTKSCGDGDGGGIRYGAECKSYFANIEIILIIVIFVSGFFYPDNMDKTIITVTGKDTVGIIARICTILAENKVNILDITQTG